MRLIATIEGTQGTFITLGDSNHDGRNEVIMVADTLPCNYRIFECNLNNSYSLQYTGGCFYPYAMGDLDHDGKTDLAGQNGGYLQVLESADANSYPTELVWSSPYLSNITGDAAIGDTDHDGHMEIIFSQNFNTKSILLIYENRGDNDFALAYSDTAFDSGGIGNKVIADLDGDGLTEIACSGGLGRFYVYTALANDTWARIWKGSVGVVNAYAVSVGMDADGNGKPELFVMGSQSEWTTKVYEAAANDSFVETATISVQDGFGGGPYNATANLDNSGKQEYVMDTGTGLCVYRASSPGQWHLVEQIPDQPPYLAHDGVHAFDLNQNGRTELVWTGGPGTLILEQRSGVSGIEQSPVVSSGSLTMFPNPCRTQAELRVGGRVDGATQLGIYDVAGRLVERRPWAGGGVGRILWPTQHLSSGVYVLRLENTSGRALAVGRGIVTR